MELFDSSMEIRFFSNWTIFGGFAPIEVGFPSPFFFLFYFHKWVRIIYTLHLKYWHIWYNYHILVKLWRSYYIHSYQINSNQWVIVGSKCQFFTSYKYVGVEGLPICVSHTKTLEDLFIWISGRMELNLIL